MLIHKRRARQSSCTIQRVQYSVGFYDIKIKCKIWLVEAVRTLKIFNIISRVDTTLKTNAKKFVKAVRASYYSYILFNVPTVVCVYDI